MNGHCDEKNNKSSRRPSMNKAYSPIGGVRFSHFFLYMLLVPFLYGTALSQAQSEQQKLTSDTLFQKQITLTPEQTLRRRHISDLQLSPDGTHMAMTVTEPVQGTERNSDIWILDTKTRKVSQFTSSKESDQQPRWSPDGLTLAFLSNRTETQQIYALSMKGGEAEVLTKGKNSVLSFEWSPDGKCIAFLAPESKAEDEEKKEKDKDDARIADHEDNLPQLWVMNVNSREIRQLTRGAWRISEYDWTPNADQLILSATDHPQPELLTNRIYSLQVSNGTMQKIASPSQPFDQIKISPDGKSIAYVGTHADGPEAHDLFIQPFAQTLAKNLTRATIDRPIISYAWQKDGRLLALAATGFSNTFYDIRKNGKVTVRKLLEGHPYGSFSVESGLLAFVGQTATQAPEVWISSHSGKAEKVTHFNSEWDSIAAIQPEIFTYPSFDGIKIEAALLKPEGYQNGNRVPLIVLVHGGPAGRWSDSFEAWGQLLAANGFAVLSPNIRGSVGYGYDFLSMNRSDWGGGDFRDVMAGVDFLIKEGIADPERLGIGGWSYGGYMAAWAVTQTSRFKASVSGAPMTDLASEYGTEMSAINAADTWYLGTPYENLSLFIDRSPVTYVKNVQTPTLILCGEKDATDPVGQCWQFYRGLKRYGVETELILYPREGHGIREEKHQINVLSRMLEWFTKYLMHE